MGFPLDWPHSNASQLLSCSAQVQSNSRGVLTTSAVYRTILRIIERAGGWNPGLFLKIENAPYMALVIEAIEEGPSGLPTVSVTHYSERNGDLMRDPEMCFELHDGELDPY
jgi:hypothetical protein